MNAKAYFNHTHTTGPLDIDLGQPQCSRWYCITIYDMHVVYMNNVYSYIMQGVSEGYMYTRIMVITLSNVVCLQLLAITYTFLRTKTYM